MSPFDSFIGSVQDAILMPLITLVALAAFVLFIWGVVEFIANADNDEKRKQGQMHILWGLIGLVIVFGANAIIAILSRTVGL